MSLTVQEITCRTALTGSGGHATLNPYGGCEHACVYCYATYLTQWRAQSDPWGSWVQVKTNVARVLEREVARRPDVHVFMSTACDAYQPVEEHYELTRRCLSVLALAARRSDQLALFLVTKSDRVLRDLDILQAFPPGQLQVAFSLTTHRDDVAAVVEPQAPTPSRRLAALRTLTEAGVRAGLFISPVLPYLTEQDLPELLAQAEAAGCRFASFDLLRYLDRHVGGALREAYKHFGAEAQMRLAQARYADRYEPQVRDVIARACQGRPWAEPGRAPRADPEGGPDAFAV